MEKTLKNILNKHGEGKLICQKCHKVIMDVAFIIVGGQIVSPVKIRSGILFSCPEHAANYAKVIIMHSVCWIEMLREYGSKLYDMTKTAEKYKKEKEDGMGKDKSK